MGGYLNNKKVKKKMSSTNRKKSFFEATKPIEISKEDFMKKFNAQDWNGLFDAIDTNGTEMISKEELGQFFNHMGVKFSWEDLESEIWAMDKKYFDDRVGRECFCRRLGEIYQ